MLALSDEHQGATGAASATDAGARPADPVVAPFRRGGWTMERIRIGIDRNYDRSRRSAVEGGVPGATTGAHAAADLRRRTPAMVAFIVALALALPGFFGARAAAET